MLHGHPLYGHGLEGYEAHVVHNSAWITELVDINRVHLRFRDSAWTDLRHFLFVLHDETLECVAHGFDIAVERGALTAASMAARSMLAHDRARLSAGAGPACEPGCAVRLPVGGSAEPAFAVVTGENVVPRDHIGPAGPARGCALQGSERVPRRAPASVASDGCGNEPGCRRLHGPHIVGPTIAVAAVTSAALRCRDG